MALNEQDWRPITFQGVTFPATLMGISILEPVLRIADEEIGDWLWRLPICKGVTKSAPAERCARCAQRTIDLMLEQRQSVIDGIRDRLASHGFDVENTYRDWIVALQQIVELSKAANGDCSWSAPMHPNDKYKTSADVSSLLDALDRERSRLRKTTDGGN
jgi:hypothetical protein